MVNTNLNKILERGYKEIDDSLRMGDLKVYAKENDRILYNTARDIIVLEYNKGDNIVRFFGSSQVIFNGRRADKK